MTGDCDEAQLSAPDVTWVEIDLGALKANLRCVRRLAGEGTRLLAVVKGNAYGHGLEQIARAAAGAGADWLGVARPSEGLRVRQCGLTTPVLVLTYTPPGHAPAAIAADLALAVYDLESAQAYAQAARAQGRRARLHVKVDTGMGRLGLPVEDVPAFLDALARLDGAVVEGLYTHFASADSREPVSARRQLDRFDSLLGVLAATGRRPPLVHAANSAALLTLPASRYDLVRVGILLYGMAPSDEVPSPPDLRPVLRWKATVAQVKTFPAGHGIGYGHAYVTRAPEPVAIVTVGYADGYRRVLERNEVLVRGRRLPVLGRVSMDQITVGLGELAGVVQPGEEVVLVGEQGQARITADELAQRWGAINYEVTSGITARVARVYV